MDLEVPRKRPMRYRKDLECEAAVLRDKIVNEILKLQLELREQEKIWISRVDAVASLMNKEANVFARQMNSLRSKHRKRIKTVRKGIYKKKNQIYVLEHKKKKIAAELTASLGLPPNILPPNPPPTA